MQFQKCRLKITFKLPSFSRPEIENSRKSTTDGTVIVLSFFPFVFFILWEKREERGGEGVGEHNYWVVQLGCAVDSVFCGAFSFFERTRPRGGGGGGGSQIAQNI